MIAEPLPIWLQSVVDDVNSTGIFGHHPANHVLLNEYLPGQGIMPHLDGDLFYPTITTVSLGSHTVLDFYEPLKDDGDHRSLEDRFQFSLFVRPRSLLVLKEDLYHKYLHGIREVDSDQDCEGVVIKRYEGGGGKMISRGTRISLTIRNVPKTTKMKIKLGR